MAEADPSSRSEQRSLVGPAGARRTTPPEPTSKFYTRCGPSYPSSVSRLYIFQSRLADIAVGR